MYLDKQIETSQLFQDTNITVCATGKRYLDEALGCDEFTRVFLGEKGKKWVGELDGLVKFASSEPHAAFAALTHGLFGHWLYAF